MKDIWSEPEFYPQPKAKKTAQQSRRARVAARELADRKENDIVRDRSGGGCEMPGCHARSVQVHHLLSGSGIRGREDSKLAQNKIDLCLYCHHAIHSGQISLRWADIKDRFGSLRRDG